MHSPFRNLDTFGGAAMSVPGSVTGWLNQLKDGDQAALQPLLKRYYQGLLEQACQKLRHTPRRVADEEDVVLMAFERFYQGLQNGRFPRLDDRDDLWRLLVLLTRHAACDLRRKLGRKKRGGQVSPTSEADLAQVLCDEPGPEEAVQVAEECRRLLEKLPNDKLRSIFLRKLEGHTNEEIARQIGCVTRTVERGLEAIRSIWNEEIGP
jgi:RNA polymerase sigma factor (sigma-70 family)